MVLWFEHDLYDQLQLIQILAWFAANAPTQSALFLLQADDFLGTQKPEALAAMQGNASPVTDAQLELAARGWNAFRQPTPQAWAGLLDGELKALPYLQAAVRRMLEELPDLKSGLARTQQAILQQIAAGVIRPGDLFGAVQKTEAAAFMGDWSFWDRLDGLAGGDAPLIEGLDAGPFSPVSDEAEFKAYLACELRLSALGRAVLAGEDDYLNHHVINLWIGGTHLTPGNIWRWDRENGELTGPQ